jgi:hypothetical protein
MNKYFIKILLIFLVLLFTINLFSVPEKKDVEKAVNKEIKKEIDKNKRNQFIRDFFSSIYKIFSNISTLISYSFIIFCIVIIGLIITFIIIRNASSSKYNSRFTNAIKEAYKESVYDEEYFQKLMLNNEYSKAIVYLHRCTIFYLIKNKLIYSKNITNNSLYKKIKNDSIKDAFKNIYVFSEKILFDDYEADNNDMNICKELYYKNFRSN